MRPSRLFMTGPIQLLQKLMYQNLILMKFLRMLIGSTLLV